MKENPTSDEVIKEMPKVLANGIDQFETAVPLEELAALNKGMLQRPEGFNGFKRLNRIYKRRETMLEEGNKADWGAGDRKSTRLNSSHVAISYAAFCLKKKIREYRKQ